MAQGMRAILLTSATAAQSVELHNLETEEHGPSGVHRCTPLCRSHIRAALYLSTLAAIGRAASAASRAPCRDDQQRATDTHFLPNPLQLY